MKKFLFGILGLLFAVPAVADCQSVNLISSTAPRTWQENTLTITSNGQGTYTLNGTLTANNTYTLANINTFTIPESVVSGGTGSLYLGNTKELSACKISLQYNTNVIDTWALADINRTATSYTSMASKQINNIAIQCTSDTTVDNLSLSPAIYNDSRTNFGEFVPGCPNYDNTCRNLFDVDTMLVRGKAIRAGNVSADNPLGSEMNNVAWDCTDYISVLPDTTYTYTIPKSTNAGAAGMVFYSDKSVDGAISGITQSASLTGTFTTPPNCQYVRFSWYHDDVNLVQLEQGPTATEYVPYCANQIKIATTAYNSARFSPVVTDLNDTIATIRSVVTNTINQTKAIADLQATKQTRPNENCPAGKKCLLVEDDAGQPHWYEIIENVYGLPAGYTELEYIESSGTQYIDTNITGSTNAIIDMQGTPRTDEMIVFMLAPIDATAYQNGFGQYLSTMPGGFGITTRRVYNVSYTSNSMTVNGVNVSNDRYIANNVNLALFGSTANNRKIRDAKLYSAKIYNNDTLLRNFVPAKNSSGVIGLYDTVSGTFFTNVGTGTFTAGPVVQ